mgnify:FL=1
MATKLQRRKKAETKRLFLQYIRGGTLREIALDCGLSHAGLAKRFEKLHPDYASLVRRGVLLTCRRYLHSKKVSNRQRQEVEAWLLENLESVLASESESSKERSFYSERKIEQLSRRETGFKEDSCLMLGDLLWNC